MLESLHAVWMRRGIIKTRASRFAVVDVEKNIDINDVSSFYASTFPTPTTVFFLNICCFYFVFLGDSQLQERQSQSTKDSP